MNKAVVIESSGCAAYTGLAFLDGRKPTDEFLMQSIDDAAASGSNALEHMARSATRAVRLNAALPKARSERAVVARTSFVVAAFARSGELVSRVPTLTVVSNAQFDMSESWEPEARPRFQMTQRVVTPGEWLIHVAGQPLPVHVRKELIRNLSRAIKRCVGPEPVARLVSRAVQTVHESNEWVGPSVNCIIVRDVPPQTPTQADGQEGMAIPLMMVPLGVYAMREANYFTGPRGDIRAEPVSAVFLPHPDHPEVALGPSFVFPGQMQVHSPMLAPEPVSAVASKAVADLRAGLFVDLQVPKQFRRAREPRTLP